MCVPIKMMTMMLMLLLLPLRGQCELNFNNDLENNQKFKSVPTTIKSYENETVLLPCYLDTPFHYVRWHRDDVPLVDSRHPEIPPPERIVLWSNGSLQVSNLKSEDTGNYYCEIMSNSNHAVQAHAIEVQYEPSVAMEPSGVLELPIGTTFEVVCLANGVPQPAISWRLNGNTLDQYSNTGNRQSHIFEIKSRAMSGLIECLAANGVGQPAVAGVQLRVLFAPELTLPQPVVYTKVGDRAQLECIVEAAPVAKLQWFHYGVPIQTGSHISSHETELSSSSHALDNYVSLVKHVLIIKKVRDADMGQYECRATNSIGFKSTTVELTGRPMPCVFKINPGTQSSTSHVLVWQTESLLPIMEFKLKFRQIPSANVTRPIRTNWTELTIPAQMTIGPIYITSYTLHGLQPASLYEVSVLARNSFGWSDNSKTVRFATGGEVELPNYSTESELQYDATEESFENEITQRSQVFTASMVHNAAAGSGCSELLYLTIFIQICLAMLYT
ncbi:PREDICTED: neurotrimin isoform X2 [Drosophila arizonae]|uniref:Neurotrimin isoform X1 n=1 Tax=Drosophila arizonae TaxID=7263 RepID=A0ABM1PKJ4_DROAR|nr:PREDICTED: neurotrimin isoform X1 [Drosophila arizonae]XP_017867731.1 PREDICTED: neurotrimin isoform X2 [Drosophila arizonae]